MKLPVTKNKDVKEAIDSFKNSVLYEIRLGIPDLRFRGAKQPSLHSLESVQNALPVNVLKGMMITDELLVYKKVIETLLTIDPEVQFSTFREIFQKQLDSKTLRIFCTEDALSEAHYLLKNNKTVFIQFLNDELEFLNENYEGIEEYEIISPLVLMRNLNKKDDILSEFLPEARSKILSDLRIISDGLPGVVIVDYYSELGRENYKLSGMSSFFEQPEFLSDLEKIGFYVVESPLDKAYYWSTDPHEHIASFDNPESVTKSGFFRKMVYNQEKDITVILTKNIDKATYGYALGLGYSKNVGNNFKLKLQEECVETFGRLLSGEEIEQGHQFASDGFCYDILDSTLIDLSRTISSNKVIVIEKPTKEDMEKEFALALEGITRNLGTTEKRNISDMIRGLNDLKSREVSIRKELEKEKLMLKGKQESFNSESLNELNEFLMSSENIIDYKFANENWLRMIIKTDMSCYDLDDVELRLTSLGTKNEISAKTLKYLFKEQRGSAQFTVIQGATLNLNTGEVQRISYNSISDDAEEYVIRNFEGSIVNPHLEYYSCFGSSKEFITKAIDRNDIIGAIQQTIVSCSNMNMLDEAVYNRFADLLSRGHTQTILTTNKGPMTLTKYIEECEKGIFKIEGEVTSDEA